MDDSLARYQFNIRKWVCLLYLKSCVEVYRTTIMPRTDRRSSVPEVMFEQTFPIVAKFPCTRIQHFFFQRLYQLLFCFRLFILYIQFTFCVQCLCYKMGGKSSEHYNLPRKVDAAGINTLEDGSVVRANNINNNSLTDGRNLLTVGLDCHSVTRLSDFADRRLLGSLALWNCEGESPRVADRLITLSTDVERSLELVVLCRIDKVGYLSVG